MQWEGDQSEDDDSEEDVYSRTVTNPYEDVSQRTAACWVTLTCQGSYQDGHGVASISSGLKEVNLAAHNNAFGQSAANKGSTIVSESDLLKSYSDEEFAGGYSGKGKGKEKAQGWQTFASEKDGKQAKEFVGYDSKGGAHRQVRSPSAVASDDSIEIVTNAPRGRSRYSHAKV